jgi:membrane-associated phospholipid phosphatase
MSLDPSTLAVWLFISRLGEAQILLPVALGLSVWLLVRMRATPIVPWWLALVAVAATITTVTKVAFIGWGVGSASLDFTGISGHAMFAAAIYPVLCGLALSGRSMAWQRAGWLAGALLAALIAVSRVMVQAHSTSEAASGFVLGGAASALAIALARPRSAPIPLWTPVLLVAWFSFTPVHAPRSITHDVVTRLALRLSGRDVPYTRIDLLRPRIGDARPAAAQPATSERRLARALRLSVSTISEKAIAA